MTFAWLILCKVELSNIFTPAEVEKIIEIENNYI